MANENFLAACEYVGLLQYSDRTTNSALCALWLCGNSISMKAGVSGSLATNAWARFAARENRAALRLRTVRQRYFH